MTYEEVVAMMEEMNLPFAYDHFVEGESQIGRASCRERV